MSLSGTTNTYLPPTLDGLNIIEADAIYINGIPIDTENLVPYTNATKNLNLGVFNFQTLGSITAKQHVFPTFPSTIMTSPTTSSIFYADAWEFNNTIQISSLGGGAFLSTSYLRLADGSNNSTLLTLQSDGIADFGNSIPRASTLAMGNYDLVNLSTLTNAVAYLEGITSLNFVPYTNALQNLDMGGSTITTSGLMSAGAVRITSSVINADYTLSVNTYDQLEFCNLSNGSIFKTNGADLFVSGTVNCATLGATNVEAGSNIYLAKGSTAEWRTTLGMSDEYEIVDDAGVMRSRLSKTTGLTVSSLSITQVPSATPTLALGLDGSNSVVSFPVPTASNILPLANTFTNTNTFLSTLTTGIGYTTSINGALSTTLNDLGFTSASFTTAGITGAYTPPLGTITNPSGSTYQIAQTAQGRSIMAISGFTPSVGITYVFEFNMNCTVGTATISVEQDNIMVSPALYPLSTGFNRVIGSFTYNGTPNTVVFKIYTGVASWNAQWDSFVLSTYSIGMNADMNALTVSNRFTQRYNALAGDVSTLVNRATMDSAISAGSIVNLNNTFIGTNAFNNDVSLGVSTVVVNQQSITTSILQTAGISSQALGGTAVISGSYLLTPTPTTFAYASVYSPSQSFLANSKYNYLFTGFTAGIFGVSLTVYQANVANTGFIAISSTVPVVVGTFSGIFTPNSNPSYLGQVYFTFSGINNKTVGWTTFTYQRGMETVNGNLAVNANETIAGTLTVSGATTITADTTSNGFILNGGGSYVAGSIFSDANWGMLFRARIAGTAAAFSWHNSTGTERLRMTDAGVMSHTAGDSSYMRYGPNATWSSYLVVGATPDRAGAGTAQVITTNGNLHLDAGNGNNMYYGYYATSRSTPNAHLFYGTIQTNTVPYNTNIYAHTYVMGDGAVIHRSQCLMRRVYQVDYISWGPGINMAYAFYKYSQVCPVRISGKYSGYCTFVGMPTMTMRIYSQSSGATRYYAFPTYQNITYAQTTYPIDIILDHTLLPETGWFDIYIYNSYGMSTDINNQLWVNVQLLPVNSF